MITVLRRLFCRSVVDCQNVIYTRLRPARAEGKAELENSFQDVKTQEI